MNRYPILIVLLCLVFTSGCALNMYGMTREQADVSGACAIRGKVVDEYGDPVIGCSVFTDEDRKNATITDVEGDFILHVLGLPCELNVSYVGYAEESVEVNADNFTNIKIELKPVSSLIDEVVVAVSYTHLTLPTKLEV